MAQIGFQITNRGWSLMASAELIAELMRVGGPDLVAWVTSEMMSAVAAGGDTRSTRQKRNARHYQTRKGRLKASEIKTSESVLNVLKASEIKTPRCTRGSRIPLDWKVSEEDIQIGLSLGFSEPEIRNEEQGFKDYWEGCGKPKVDWHKTFRVRLRQESGRLKLARGRFRPGQLQLSRPTV